MENLTKEEIEQFRTVSDKMKFPIPIEAFFAWCRNFYVNSTELAILRKTGSEREIFLNLRPSNDPYYANMWHIPGTVCLPRKTLAETVRNCITSEIGGGLPDTLIPETFVKHWDNTDETRGHTNQFLYVIDLPENETYKLEGGQFFPLDNLPTPMLKSHIRVTDWLKNYLTN